MHVESENAHYSTYLFQLFMGEFENLISHFPTPLLSARTCSARLSFALASWAKNVMQKMLYKKCYTKNVVADVLVAKNVMHACQSLHATCMLVWHTMVIEHIVAAYVMGR